MGAVHEVLAGCIVLGVVYVIVGLALQHAAYILQYGSIFQRPRNWLREYCDCDTHPVLCRWFCGLIRDAIMCQVCCITQLVFWCWTLPLTVCGVVAIHTSFPAVPLPLVGSGAVLVGGMLWFSQAAVGVACWDIMRLIGRGTDAIIKQLRTV